MDEQNFNKIMIVDDHQMVVDGLQSLLYNVPQMKVVGQTNNPLHVLPFLKTTKVDLLITDINMVEMSGIELTRLVKAEFPLIKIICLSMFSDQLAIKEMIMAGVDAYILKNTGKEELLEAIDTVLKGKSFFSKEITQQLVNNINENVVSKLTNREIEIICLIEKEYGNKQIADKLFISERTVETHRKNIFRKTETQSIVGLIKYAYAHRIVS